MTVRARFCPRCGASLAYEPPVVCATCDYALWVNPRPTGTVILVQDGRFLALKRAREPRSGWWDLPGGFCDGRELPADAAVREAREELGLAVRLDALVGMYLSDYLYQDEVLPILDCIFLATIVGGALAVDPAEATDHAWLPLATPPEMAFPNMDRALVDVRALLA